MKTVLWTAAIIAAGTATLTCGPDPLEYEGARILWSNRPFEDYRFTLQMQCFCVPGLAPPVVIDVVNGFAASVTYADTGVAAGPGLFENYDTIEKLFDIIQDVYDREFIYVRQQYDPDLGYPVDVFIDYSMSIADDELGFTVTNVGPVE